jgi:hypothetical protein
MANLPKPRATRNGPMSIVRGLASPVAVALLVAGGCHKDEPVKQWVPPWGTATTVKEAPPAPPAPPPAIDARGRSDARVAETKDPPLSDPKAGTVRADRVEEAKKVAYLPWVGMSGQFQEDDDGWFCSDFRERGLDRLCNCRPVNADAGLTQMQLSAACDVIAASKGCSQTKGELYCCRGICDDACSQPNSPSRCLH